MDELPGAVFGIWDSLCEAFNGVVGLVVYCVSVFIFLSGLMNWSITSNAFVHSKWSHDNWLIAHWDKSKLQV